MQVGWSENAVVIGMSSVFLEYISKQAHDNGFHSSKQERLAHLIKYSWKRNGNKCHKMPWKLTAIFA